MLPPRNSTSTSCAGYLIPSITLYTYLTTLLGADVFEYSNPNSDFDSDPEEAIDPINRPHPTADAFDIWSEYESWRRRLAEGGSGEEGGEGVPKVFCIVNPEDKEGEEERYSLFAPVRLVHSESTSRHNLSTTNSTDASTESTSISNSSPLAPPELETPSDRTHLLTSLQTLNNYLQNPEVYTLKEDGIKFTLVPLKQLPPSCLSYLSFSLSSSSASNSTPKHPLPHPHPSHSHSDPESTEYCAGYHLATIPAFHYVSSLVGLQAFNPDPPDPPTPSSNSNSNPELDDDSIVDPVGDPHPEDGLAIAAEYHAWRGALGVEERGCEILPFVTEDPEPMIALFIPIRIFYHVPTSTSSSTTSTSTSTTSPTPSPSETQQDRLQLQNILTKLNRHVHEEEHHLDETHVTFLALPVDKFSTRPFTSDKRCTAWDLY